jgi:hypothetical protein
LFISREVISSGYTYHLQSRRLLSGFVALRRLILRSSFSRHNQGVAPGSFDSKRTFGSRSFVLAINFPNSGQRHPDYLALENGFGSIRPVLVDDMKRYVSEGGSCGSLLDVVVSACHSKNTEEDFSKLWGPSPRLLRGSREGTGYRGRSIFSKLISSVSLPA